jgi:phosphatidylglycerophosphate synthase
MLKHSLSDFQSRIGHWLKPVPFHPNDVTLLSVLFAAIGAYFVWQHNWLGPLFFLLSFAFDGLDGALARAKNLVSSFGAYLDGVCDRLVEFFALLPFLLLPLPADPALWLTSLFFPALLTLFFGSCMTAFSKAYADHREVCDAKTAAHLRTLMPRTERVIAIWVAMLLFIEGRMDVLLPLMWVIAIGSILTFVWLQKAAWQSRQKNR